MSDADMPNEAAVEAIQQAIEYVPAEISFFTSRAMPYAVRIEFRTVHSGRLLYGNASVPILFLNRSRIGPARLLAIHINDLLRQAIVAQSPDSVTE